VINLFELLINVGKSVVIVLIELSTMNKKENIILTDGKCLMEVKYGILITACILQI
jgi:hypothetical protein